MDEIFTINNNSKVPKYQQIIGCIQDALKDDLLKKGDKIPSLNQMMRQFNLSQDTVLMAYNELKMRGVISSSVGKGYYVASNITHITHKVFLLFDKLTAYKEILYESLKKEFSKKGSLDIYFHHSNKKLFKNLIEAAAGNYTSYIIMPLEQKSCLQWLNLLPPKQLYLLDRGKNLIDNRFAGVFQDFESDTLKALNEGLHLIKNYTGIKVVSNDHRRHLQEIINGCKRFCIKNKLKFTHLKDSDEVTISKGDIFLVINDNDLVSIVKTIEKQRFTIGKEVGLISYNDTPLKQIAAGGISTISTDFDMMGKNMADMILNRQRKVIDNPSKIILRDSL